MVKFLLPLLAACTALAQSPADLFQKAPPDVDAALRARIQEFYTDHTEGKFRQAEKLVAEDTKDFFYASSKPKYVSCETKSITYSDNFTRAKAMIACDMYVNVIGFAGHLMKLPHTSTWKIEPDGKWYWYVDPESLKESPFGKMTPGQQPGTRGLPGSFKELAGSMGNGVTADKTDVALETGQASSQTVTFSNGMPGMITLTLLQGTPIAGLKARLDSQQVAAGGKGALTISWKPGSPVPANPAQIRIRVEQTNQEFPISISFRK